MLWHVWFQPVTRVERRPDEIEACVAEPEQQRLSLLADPGQVPAQTPCSPVSQCGRQHHACIASDVEHETIRNTQLVVSQHGADLLPSASRVSASRLAGGRN